jgi:hypothetical protein
MQPRRGQYNDVLANDTYLVAFCGKTILHGIRLVDFMAELHKASFILSKYFLKILIFL